MLTYKLYDLCYIWTENNGDLDLLCKTCHFFIFLLGKQEMGGLVY